MKHFSCALSGHRALPEDFDVSALKEKLEELILAGCNEFYCGMAEGFDLTALKCLFELKEKYSLSVEACIPFRGQERHFKEEAKAFYREALPLCDRQTEISPEYGAGCYHMRNRYMVDSADMLLAYCTKKRGGTYYTVCYALETQKEVVFFP